MDDRLSSLEILSVENACVRSLDYNGIIDAFAPEKLDKEFLRFARISLMSLQQLTRIVPLTRSGSS